MTYRVETMEAPVVVMDKDSVYHTVAARRSIHAATG